MSNKRYWKRLKNPPRKNMPDQYIPFPIFLTPNQPLRILPKNALKKMGVPPCPRKSEQFVINPPPLAIPGGNRLSPSQRKSHTWETWERIKSQIPNVKNPLRWKGPKKFPPQPKFPITSNSFLGF